MRSGVGNFTERTRTSSTRFTFKDSLLRFDSPTFIDEIGLADEPIYTDFQMIGTDVYGLAVLADGRMYRSLITLGATTRTWSYFASALAGSIPSLSVAWTYAVFLYQTTSGYLRYRTYDGSTDVTTSISVGLDPTSAAVYFVDDDPNHARVFIYKRTDYAAGSIGQILFVQASGIISTWDGIVYSSDTFLPPISVGYEDGEYSILFQDKNGKRAALLTYSPSLDIWSGLEPIIPIDPLDDESQLTVGKYSVINGKHFVTLIIQRKNGRPMHIYSNGPREFTFGRDKFLFSSSTYTHPGRLIAYDNRIYYLGYKYMTSARAVGMFSNQTGYVTQRVNNFSAGGQVNSPMTLSAVLAHDEVLKRIAPGPVNMREGSEVIVEVSDGSSWFKLGEYEIDQIASPIGPDSPTTINAVGKGMRRLSKWSSDTAYDFWSQAKSVGNPKDRVVTVTSRGDWGTYPDTSPTHITLRDRNKDGIQYTSERGSEGSIIRARFNHISGSHVSEFGVGFNFKIETRAETAEALGVDITEITDTQLRRSAFIVKYNETDSQYELWRYDQRDGTEVANGIFSPSVTGEWSLLDSWSYTLPRDTDYWVIAIFRNSYVYVYTRADSSALWEYVGCGGCFGTSVNHTALATEDIGRSCIYIKNTSAFTQCYNTFSDSDVIPVLSNSLFPASGEVIIDSEQILYAGKTSQTGLDQTYALSHSHGIVGTEWVGTGGTTISFGNSRTTCYAIQTFALSAPQDASAVRLWLQKIGNPERGVNVCIFGPTINEDLGTFKGSITIPAPDITTAGGYITVNFKNRIPVVSGDWIVLMFDADPSVADASNYYKVKVWGSGYAGVFYTFNENTDVWTSYSSYDMDFKLYVYPTANGSAYPLVVSYTGSPSVTDNYYINMALVCYEGSGIGSSYKIVGSKLYATGIYYFLLDRKVQFDETSKFVVASSLYGLTRGNGTTEEAAHGNTLVHYYYPMPQCLCDRVEYYSAEVDLSLGDLVRKIARKAGVLDVSESYLLDTTTSQTIALTSKNAIIDISNLSIASPQYVYIHRGYGSSPGYSLIISSTQIQYLYGNLSGTQIEAFPVTLKGDVRVCFWDRYISIFQEDLPIVTFYLDDTSSAEDVREFSVALNGATGTARVSSVGTRIDNYFVQLGETGASAISRLVGNRRVFFRDDQDGGIKVTSQRETVNTISDPYTAMSEGMQVWRDVAMSRVMVEGAEVYEDFTDAVMRSNGDVFKLTSVPEIYNVEDAKFYSALLLDDAVMSTMSHNPVGACDPRVEPSDLMYIDVPNKAADDNGVSYDRVKLVIVDGVAITFNTSEDGHDFDMTLSCRSGS